MPQFCFEWYHCSTIKNICQYIYCKKLQVVYAPNCSYKKSLQRLYIIMYVHTRIYARTHLHAHAHTPTRAHTRARAYTHTGTQARTRAGGHTHTRAQAHAYTHRSTHRSAHRRVLIYFCKKCLTLHLFFGNIVHVKHAKEVWQDYKKRKGGLKNYEKMCYL